MWGLLCGCWADGVVRGAEGVRGVGDVYKGMCGGGGVGP